jgi:hypothetical protein
LLLLLLQMSWRSVRASLRRFAGECHMTDFQAFPRAHSNTCSCAACCTS